MEEDNKKLTGGPQEDEDEDFDALLDDCTKNLDKKLNIV